MTFRDGTVERRTVAGRRPSVCGMAFVVEKSRAVSAVSLEWSTSSRWLTTVEAGKCTWCAFVTCGRAAEENCDEPGTPAVRNPQAWLR